MRLIVTLFALMATALAGAPAAEGGKTCKNGQSVVCKDNGNGGILTLGNVAPGALGVDCSGGDTYCCDDKDVAVSTPYFLLSSSIANKITERPCQPRCQRPVQSEPRPVRDSSPTILHMPTLQYLKHCGAWYDRRTILLALWPLYSNAVLLSIGSELFTYFFPSCSPPMCHPN